MKKLIVLNHKSYMEYDDVIDYIKEVKEKIRTDLDIVICPSLIYLPYFSGKYKFSLGSQTAFPLNVTGEVTYKQLKSLGVKYSLVGHFERKQYGLINGELINKSIKEALNNNIIPIVCLGETKEEYLRKKTGEVLTKQLKAYFLKVDFSYDIVLVYEPAWSLQDNNILDKKDIIEIVTLIKSIIIKTYNIEPKVLYGGNINEKNIANLEKIDVLDGYLIGKSSIDKEKIIKILNLVG